MVIVGDRKMKPKGFPSLNENEVAVLQVDGITGIVLSKTGEWNTDGEVPFFVFSDLAAANHFVHHSMELYPLREYSVFRSNGEMISVHRNQEALINAAQQREKQHRR